MAAFPKYNYVHYTGATGTTVKQGEGTFAGIVINKPLQGVITLKDGATTIAVLASGTGSPIGSLLYGGAGGVQVVGLNVTMTSNSEDVTIIYE